MTAPFLMCITLDFGKITPAFERLPLRDNSRKG